MHKTRAGVFNTGSGTGWERREGVGSTVYRNRMGGNGKDSAITRSDDGCR